jgi:excisionase family DNA binding protein
MSARLTPKEVAKRLNVGTRAVYELLEQGILPGIRLGRRWLITAHAYDQWEKTCGVRSTSDRSGSIGLEGPNRGNRQLNARTQT